jgi:eukaryotic-like serine/threonine-protein kinase
MGNQDQSAEEIFGAVLELPPEQRSAYLLKACRESPQLRGVVDELLSDYRRMGTFLDDPVIHLSPDPPSFRGTSSLGQMLRSGMTLGRYTILAPLGAGGMGAVYRAQDEKLERIVAIKILSPGVLTNDDSRRRFRKEALALAKLGHNHIAAVHDVGEQDGIDYIVMECVPGETLAAKLRGGPLTVKDATSIIMQVAEALEEAHEQGVIHRDLKPANVMITPKGQAKVLDFGIAKLLAPAAMDAIASIETGMLLGTPFYMSPEQAQGMTVDTRTDLWSLGVIYYESLSGRTPFQADSNIATLHAILKDAPTSLRQLRPDAPSLAEQIVSHALQKGTAARYQTATEMVRDTAELLAGLSITAPLPEAAKKGRSRALAFTACISLIFAIAAGLWTFHRWSGRQWAREEALPQVESLLKANQPLAALSLLERARAYLPQDPQFKQVAEENTTTVSVGSSPSGATIEIQDYATPNGEWHRLGVTPLANIQVPQGYFRWKVAKGGSGEWIGAPKTQTKMYFRLDTMRASPAGMVSAPGGSWTGSIDFVGFVGPYSLPAYYVDRYEVTNREYQRFVDSGGYEKKEYWTERFIETGHELSWNEAMAKFRDTTGRPGPSNWIAGHYLQGQAEFPVSGVSWFEASAYAAFAGKSLPALAQWYQTAPPDAGRFIVPVSNFSGSALAPVGAYRGVGPYGTYDTAGNVREWTANADETGSRFILGGSWRSPSYLYYDPETLSPFDRSEANGFRCVKNTSPLPVEATQPVKRWVRDFSGMRPVPDDVFRAYELLYTYPKSPLHAESEGIVKETADWREEKVTYDTGYRGERMSAYLFLPKNVRPPYQTVLFFPSARVLFLPDSQDGRGLGDMKFFDYVVQSGRAVLYPIYENMYERQVKFSLPGGSQNIQLTTDWYKDAARSLDYLATRPDIDSSKLAYLGVSMGSAEGVIAATLLQDRLRTAVFLDGGYFLDPPSPGGDQAEFAPRMKKPVLMVNGRYDYTFSLEKAQNPLFAMLGTAEKDKRHIILDTPHDVTEQRPLLVRGVLDWLDRYLGRVSEQTTR